MLTAEQVKAALQSLSAMTDAYGDYCHANDDHRPLDYAVSFAADDPYNGCSICAICLMDALNKETP